MKRTTGKVLAVGFAAVLGLGVLAGCGAETGDYIPGDYEEEDFEDYEEEDYEDYMEEDFEEGDYEDEPEDPDVNQEGEYETEPGGKADEPVEGLSDQVLMKGYYGVWKGDTEYIFGVLSDKDFMINVVGASGPILYAEGEYRDNGDGTYTASITSTDNDFAADQTIAIRAEGGPDISLTSDSADVRAAVEGAYTYAGENASDVDGLK